MASADSSWFADLSPWRKLSVRGSDARPWLNDLVSADLAGLEPGRSRRSLLLSPTGKVRAEFSVGAVIGGFVLLQDPTQLSFAGDILAPYVLSSAVELRDRTTDLGLFALTGDVPADLGETLAPSCVGQGSDLLVEAGERARVRSVLAGRLQERSPEDLEDGRVRAGIPRLAVDGAPDDLPEEAGLDGAVARNKGCFLGQEAVARTRNLGHPRRVLLHLRAQGPARAGEDVLAVSSNKAGVITSAASQDDRATVVLARVAWEAREAPLRTAGGVALVRLDHS